MIDAQPLLDEADPVGSVFAPMIGLPAWNVQKGQGSFLTFDFGAPYLAISEPVAHPATENPEIRKRLQSRSVRPHGEYYLWIYCCHWRCVAWGDELAHDESAVADIVAATRFLDGQILLSVEVDPALGKSLFRFDLGGTLATWPYDDEDNEEQWLLDTPSRYEFGYRADGFYSWGSIDLEPDQEVWRPLPQVRR